MSFMFKSDSLANVETGERPVARASTKYMETFQLVRPALGGTDIRTYPNVTGNLDIYTIGTNDAVHRLRRGRDADAPYEDANLNIVGRQLFLYTGDNEGSDTPNILSLGPAGQLKLATYQPGVSSYYQADTKPANATETIVQFKGARGVTGNIYVNVMLQEDGSDLGILANNFFRPGTSTWAGPVWAPLTGPDGQVARVKGLAMVENNPVQSAIFAIGHDDLVWFAESSDRTAALRALGPKKVTQLSVVSDAENRLNIFAVEKDTGKLLLKRQKKYSVGAMQFDDWVYIDQGSSAVLRGVYASQRFDDLLQVFGIAEDGRLWRASQRPAASRGASPSWQSLFPLGNEIPASPGQQASIFTVGRDAAGYAEAYTVSAEGELRRFWQSPSSQQWFEEAVGLPRNDNEMAKVPTHALELTILDKDGVPQANVPITVQASSLVTLFVDGRSYRCSQLDRVAVWTGPAGKVVLQQKANALAAATLYVETPATLAGAPLVIQPNLQLQERLETLTVEEIKDAKGASGAYLLPPEFRTDTHAQSLQEITRASMSIASQDENGKGKVNYHFVSRGAKGQRFKNRLDLSAVEGTAWAIDFSSGFPTYEVMSTNQVAAWRTERLTAMRGAGLADAEAGGFFDVDWGDVWNGIKNGVKSIVDGLIRIVVEVVEGVGRVLFQIGETVFEAVIEFAQQAFDFVQGVWNWLKVKLEQLYEWLAFLFNIPDIVRTAEAIQHSTEVVLDFTIAGVEALKESIMAGFDTLKSELSETVDSFVEILNRDNDPSIGAYASKDNPSDEQLYESEHNPFGDAYEQNHGKASEKGQNLTNLLASRTVSDPLEQLLGMFEDLANNFQFDDGKAAFEEATAYFTAIGDNPNNVINLLLSGVVKTLEGVALFAIDAAKGVVGVMLDLIVDVVEAFKSVLFAEWEIPILSPLYKLFTGKTLSIRIIDVCCYVAAVPTTLLYKLARGKAPFPDQAKLDSYRDFMTVDWLKTKFGIETETALVATSAAGVDEDEWQAFVGSFCLTFYAGIMLYRIVSDSITGVANALATTDAGDQPGWVKAPSADLSQFAGQVAVMFRFMTTFATMPWALNFKTPAPSCPAGSPGFAGTIWVSQLALGPTRGLLLLLLFSKFKVPQKAKIYTGELTLTAWGAANMIMTIWNYVELPEASRNPLTLSRALTNMIPGQFTRFLFTPDMQKPLYFIPMGVGVALNVVGYLGSAGCALAAIKDYAKTSTVMIREPAMA